MEHLHLRGAGGAIWDQLVPTEDAALRLFRSQVASGFLTPLNEDDEPWTADELAAWLDDESVGGEDAGEKSASSEPPAPDEYPVGGNIDAVNAWVTADPGNRAQQALEAEQAKGEKARKSLVTHLQSVVAAGAEPDLSALEGLSADELAALAELAPASDEPKADA